MLHAEAWASYEGVIRPHSVQAFRAYYLWVLADMVPVVDVWEALPVEAPYEPVDAPAGIPVLVFKLFIAGHVFASVAMWWQGQDERRRTAAARS